MSSTWEGIDVRPREGPREPCLRRGRSMSANWKDPGNHIFDVGVDVRPWERPKEPCLRRAGRCPPMGRTQGTMSSTWGPHPPMGRTKGTMFSTWGSISAHEKWLLRRGTCNGVLAKQQCLGSLLGSRQLGEHQPGHQRLSRPFTRAAHCYTCCT